MSKLLFYILIITIAIAKTNNVTSLDNTESLNKDKIKSVYTSNQSALPVVNSINVILKQINAFIKVSFHSIH